MADETTKKPSTTTTVCLGEMKVIVDSIPKFLRSQYIVKCIKAHIAAHGAPQYTEADKAAATKLQAAKRSLGALKGLTDEALAAAGFVRATPPTPPRTTPAPAPGKGPSKAKA